MSESLINLVVLYGGKSGEHEISLVSAASVLSNLNPHRYKIIPIGLDKNGQAYLNSYQELLAYSKSLPVMTSKSVKLPSLWIDGKFVIPEADLVFPVVHGPLHEDGCLQGLLELADVAYVGCDVLSSAIAMNKDMARRVLGPQGIRHARYYTLDWSHNESAPNYEAIIADLGWPVFVKPCTLGSSVGIHKANSMAELQAAVKDAFRYDKTVLIEEFISGREVELAVLENISDLKQPLVSAPGEIIVNHPHGFYSYTAKYLESSQTEIVIPADFTKELSSELRKIAADIFLKLNCRALARVDFFVSKLGEIYFSEINTLPGFTPISMYPKLWQASGLDYSSLLDKLVDIALMHQRCKERLITNYQ